MSDSRGLIALVEDGDEIVFDIPNRSVHLDVPGEVVERRAIAQDKRNRPYAPSARSPE